MENTPVPPSAVVKEQSLVVYAEQEQGNALVADSPYVIDTIDRGHGDPLLSHFIAALLDRGRTLLALTVAGIFSLTFIVQPFRIPSESMERTLLVGDFLLVNKVIFAPAGIWNWLLPYRAPRHGDTLVFRFPLDGDDHVVKRIIGIGGDAIHLKNGVVYRNGDPLLERYTRQRVTWAFARSDNYRDNFPNSLYSDPGVDAHWWANLQRDRRLDDVVVPAGHYFVLGDNRNYSRDSRYWGFVPKPNIVGMPMIIYFSVREPSRTDAYVPPTVQDDRLGNSAFGGILRFARWTRILHVVD